jgi:hypothetical protein
LQSVPNTPLTPTPTISTLQGTTVPLHVNDLLQQLGLGHLQVAGADALPVEVRQIPPRQNANPILPPFREMPLRPLLAPLILLFLRTILLLYFVAPTRKPFFAFLVLVWMVYEIWRPIQNGLMRVHRAAGDPQGGQNVPGQQPQAQQERRQRQRELEQQLGEDDAAQIARMQLGPGAGLDQFSERVLEVAASQNITDEDGILNAVDGPNTTEPGFTHKATTLISLMFTTLHPAVWNRRRAALRPREGRIRTEAGVRNSLPTEGDEGSESRQQIRQELLAQHARRPQWVRNYIERVVAAEWVDDSD